MSKKKPFGNYGRDRASYCYRCENNECFAWHTLWDFKETIPLAKKIKGGYNQRGCPSCAQPVTILTEESALPIREEDIKDGTIQEKLFEIEEK